MDDDAARWRARRAAADIAVERDVTTFRALRSTSSRYVLHADFSAMRLTLVGPQQSERQELLASAPACTSSAVLSGDLPSSADTNAAADLWDAFLAKLCPRAAGERAPRARGAAAQDRWATRFSARCAEWAVVLEGRVDPHAVAALSSLVAALHEALSADASALPTRGASSSAPTTAQGTWLATHALLALRESNLLAALARSVCAPSLGPTSVVAFRCVTDLAERAAGDVAAATYEVVADSLLAHESTCTASALGCVPSWDLLRTLAVSRARLALRVAHSGRCAGPARSGAALAGLPQSASFHPLRVASARRDAVGAAGHRGQRQCPRAPIARTRCDSITSLGRRTCGASVGAGVAR